MIHRRQRCISKKEILHIPENSGLVPLFVCAAQCSLCKTASLDFYLGLYLLLKFECLETNTAIDTAADCR